MAKTIEEAKAGDKTNKLWSKLNECIKAVNSIANCDVKFTDPGDQVDAHDGKFVVSDANSVLNLKIKASGLPPFDDSMDTAKKYAVIASYTDGAWKAEWKEVCSA
jgi:hypothetical protein